MVPNLIKIPSKSHHFLISFSSFIICIVPQTFVKHDMPACKSHQNLIMCLIIFASLKFTEICWNLKLVRSNWNLYIFIDFLSLPGHLPLVLKVNAFRCCLVVHLWKLKLFAE